MGDGVEKIHKKIRSFQKRYYLNLFIKGSILTLSIGFSYFLMATLIEHALWLEPSGRLAIFILFFAIVFYCIYRFLKDPLQWWIAKRGLGEEQSARLIGAKLPTVKDRLLNLIQLSNSSKESTLLYASVRQKSYELEPLSFESVIDLKENSRFLKYLAIPLFIILIILLFNQQIILQSSQRIINFNQEFSPQAPFAFNVTNESLTAFYNEDFTLKVRLEGSALPQDLYMNYSGQRVKLESLGNGQFVYSFENVQESLSFQLEAAGFYSERFIIGLANRPELTGFKVYLEYPPYLHRKNELIANAGNIEVPEGTVVRWELATTHSSKAQIQFSDKGLFDFQPTDDQMFMFSKKFQNPDQYEIFLENDESKNKDRIAYNINVVKDQFPQILLNNFKDSVLYNHILLGGIMSDDYGVTELLLHFKVKDQDQKDIISKRVNLPIIKNQIQQSFIHNWSIDSLRLKAGQQLEYFLEVWDNDGVNGRKSTRSASYNFFIPTEDKLVADIDNTRNQTKQKIDQSAGKANKLQDQIEEASQRLKGKQSMDWQDKKMLEDIIQQKESLDKLIQQMSEQNKLLDEKKSSFTEQEERIKEKAEQLQKLMDELLDEKTKQLFEELKKLLKENSDISQMQKLLDKLNQNSENLEKELERILELFKQLQFESKLEQVTKKLDQQIQDQKSLLEKTEQLEKNSKENNSKNEQKTNEKNEQQGANNKENEKSSSQELAKEQEQLKEEFTKTEEELKELKELGKEVGQEELPSEEELDQVQDEQQQSQDKLEQNQPSKSKPNQQKAVQQMQKMQQQMQKMQSSMSMEMDMQNLESLRHILHGLIKLSFDQENLMKTFIDLQPNDPRYNTVAQQQIKLKDDSKVLEDSLLALAKRDPYMGSFVTKEISELNNHLEKTIDANKERRKAQAQSEMQFSMTSINNLALMLDSHFDMMMQMMANAKGSMKKSQQKGQKPELSQLQQQLNSKIQELKNGGKSGRELSEELAKMAAEQERIRRALQEMQEKMKNEGTMPGGELPSKMEQTEMDLVNKQLTDQLIKRQQDILTRLLEAEKSMREQDLDDERKGETAKDYEKEIPKAFEEYLRLKEKEVELLKTVPPKLYPYYKKEVNEYFKRMDHQ